MNIEIDRMVEQYNIGNEKSVVKYLLNYQKKKRITLGIYNEFIERVKQLKPLRVENYILED